MSKDKVIEFVRGNVKRSVVDVSLLTTTELMESVRQLLKSFDPTYNFNRLDDKSLVGYVIGNLIIEGCDLQLLINREGFCIAIHDENGKINEISFNSVDFVDDSFRPFVMALYGILQVRINQGN